MSGAPARVRWVFRQVTRAPVRSVLTASTALLFSLALLWLRATIIRSEAEIAEMYQSLTIDIEIEQSMNSSTRSPEAFSGTVNLQKIETLKEEGLLQSASLQASLYFDSMFPVAGPEDGSPVFYDLARFSMLTNELCGVYCEPEDASNALPAITYAPGYDGKLFSRPWTQADLLREYPAPVVEPELFDQTAGLFAQRQADLQALPGFSLPVVLPIEMLEQMEISPGDAFYLFYIQTQLHGYTATAVPCVAVGTLAKGQTDKIAHPLAPLYALEVFASSIDEQMIAYNDVRLTVNPAQNSRLSEVRGRLESLLKDRPGRSGSWLEVTVWDEELRVVIEPLEQSYRVLSTLYPIAVLVSFAVAVGVSLLLTLQKNGDAAVLRVLGGSRGQVYGVLCIEQLILVTGGLLLALALCFGLAQRPLWPFALKNAALYLLGALLGTSFAALFMLRRTPLAFLQSRE